MPDPLTPELEAMVRDAIRLFPHSPAVALLAVVERLQEENARLRALLQPFAHYAESRGGFDGCVPLGLVYSRLTAPDDPTLDHCRAALEALTDGEPKHE